MHVSPTISMYNTLQQVHYVLETVWNKELEMVLL